MNADTDLYLSLIAPVGMMVVAAVAVIYWRRTTRLPYGWLWAGAGLWAVAVFIKFAIAIMTNAAVFTILGKLLSHPALVAIGGLYGGVQSSLCEIGFTWLAVQRWRQFGQDADRAIGVGVGAGAFEAFLLGLLSLVGLLAILAGAPGTEPGRQALEQSAAVTPVFWLVAPVERILAILCHASSRALVLLGAVHHRPLMIFWGFLIFTCIDGIATAVHVAGNFGTYSVWWIELALLPFAIVGIPILKWCRSNWGPAPTASQPVENP